MTRLATLLAAAMLGGGAAGAQDVLTFETGLGRLVITPLGHGSLRFDVAGMVIHVDPYGQIADYSQQPKADWIWLTHDHPDHYDEGAMAAVRKPDTRFLADPISADRLGEDAVVLRNGESTTVGDIRVKAVPAYNIRQKRPNGQPYHPKGAGNGYLVSFGDFVVHIGADTECVPEMRDLGRVDVSFLPINLPFTMTPQDAAECFRLIHPKVAVPYHQGDFDPQIVADALRDTDIDVRVLPLR
ncbi:MAG TPA: MBL fold metallo-hydrolase [Trueperaceae bacterium]|nr:MBL fold metallo-hydrolase [Trueperaceae bacterium]